MKGSTFIGYLLLVAYMGYRVGRKVGSFETAMAVVEEANKRYVRKEGNE